MATYRIMANIVETAPGEHQVTVSAIPSDMSSAEVRSDTLLSISEAEAQREYLVMSIATELRARGDEIAALEE
ncbi:MAG: hypothetical protein AB7P08_12835 [Burkholderiales bacterium]